MMYNLADLRNSIRDLFVKTIRVSSQSNIPVNHLNPDNCLKMTNGLRTKVGRPVTFFGRVNRGRWYEPSGSAFSNNEKNCREHVLARHVVGMFNEQVQGSAERDGNIGTSRGLQHQLAGRALSLVQCCRGRQYFHGH